MYADKKTFYISSKDVMGRVWMPISNDSKLSRKMFHHNINLENE